MVVLVAFSVARRPASVVEGFPNLVTLRRGSGLGLSRAEGLVAVVVVVVVGRTVDLEKMLGTPRFVVSAGTTPKGFILIGGSLVFLGGLEKMGFVNACACVLAEETREFVLEDKA